MPIKLKEFETPTGVHKHYYTKDINGNKLNLKNKNVKSMGNRYLSKKQSDKIKKFAVNNYNKLKKNYK